MSEPDFQQMTRREIEDYVIEKSLVDADFRRRLVASPGDTLAALGLPIGHVDIKVLVEEPGSFCIVLPRVLRDSQELAPEELDQVSGGSVFPPDDLFRGYV